MLSMLFVLYVSSLGAFKNNFIILLKVFLWHW